ncbi:MAG: hypothetical protein ABW118_10400 [Candidatus Thiodiazotropha sp.]
MDKLGNLRDALKQAERDKDLALVETIREVIHIKAEYACDSQKQVLKEALSQIYALSSGYTNLVIVGGYASAFAVWQLTKQHMDINQTMIIGTLLVISVILFMGFEVYKMISNTLFLRRLDRILDSDIDDEDRLVAWGIASSENKIKTYRLWIYFLVPTLISAFSAGLYMLWIYINNIFS